MKYLCITIFLMLYNLKPATGQTFDRIALKLSGKEYQINKVDSLGNKQGEWLHYKMFLNSKCSALSTQSADTCYRKLSEGVYLNNVKIGTWIYYDDGGCYITVERTEVYKPNGSITETKYWNTTTTDYSPDSMLVFSEIDSKGDNVCIECRERKTCIATFENEELAKFDFSSLDAEQYKVVMGLYNRKIKIIKNNNR